MAQQPQTLQNHIRIFVPYHLVAVPIFLLNVVWAGTQLVREPSMGSVVGFLVSVALVILALSARTSTLTVQDRVIRLEMQVRLRQLLPAEEHARIAELTRNQYVALRFAGDAELPALFRKVLDERIGGRKEIKQLVTDWTADHLRA